MSEQSEVTFEAASGKLGQTVYSESGDDGAVSLRFFVEIAFRPLEWDGEEHAPLLRIDNLSASVTSWKGLTDQVFEFPYAPKPGSVEAAVLMFGEHNPADVTKIEFGEAEDGKLTCRFDTEVDFEIEADRDDLEQIEMSFDLPLEVQELRVATSLEKRCQGDPDAIVAAIGDLVELSNYGSLAKVPGGFAFPVE